MKLIDQGEDPYGVVNIAERINKRSLEWCCLN
jgi:hypothetical protein